ncbi:MAG: hypothetical protein RIQ53_2785 [Pseudomonadota bacterium]|jgi:hypothetical protein
MAVPPRIPEATAALRCRRPTWSAARITTTVILALGAAAAPALAATNGIYTCMDAQGRRLTSDRPIPACNAREQQQLNSDGSLRRVVPPTLTAEERAEQEARERRDALARSAKADAVRRDRNLLSRYPDEAAHDRARDAALDPVRQAMNQGEQRMRQLADERKPLLDESEFYKGRRLPAQLKFALEQNEAASEAQKISAASQRSELSRLNALYDIELAHLRKLWAGTEPGSLPAYDRRDGDAGSSQAGAGTKRVPTPPARGSSSR